MNRKQAYTVQQNDEEECENDSKTLTGNAGQDSQERDVKTWAMKAMGERRTTKRREQ